MSFSRAFKWFLILGLPLTLATKLTIRAEDSAQAEQRILGFLAAQQFAVAETGQELNGLPVFRARSKACTVYVMRTSPDGWTRDLVQQFAGADDDIFVVFRGKLYSDKTNWSVLAGYLGSKVAFRLGLAPHVNSAIAVIAPKACDARDMPWGELRDL